jgi:hypothetical protein
MPHSVTAYEREEPLIVEPEPAPVELTIEERIREAFPENAEHMLKIAQCESGMRQFYDDGSVIISHTNDRGLFQINHIWNETADELRYNIDTIEGNILMARYVYNIQGVEAWVCHHLITNPNN